MEHDLRLLAVGTASSIGLVLLTGYLVNTANDLPQTGPAPTATETLDPGYTPEATETQQIDAILAEGTAVARSLAQFPGTPGTPVVRRISHGTLNTVWFEQSVPPDGWNPGHPVWLVGIPGTPMNIATVVSSGVIKLADNDAGAAEGMFFAWDANSGQLRSSGALVNQSTQRSLQSLAAIPTQSVVILTATTLP